MNPIAMISLHTCPLERLGMFDAGGMNVYLTNLSRLLGKLGWKVDIFTRSHPQEHRRRRCRSEELNIIHFPIGENVAKGELVNYTDKFAIKLLDYIRENKLHYKLIHAHYYLSGLAALKVQDMLAVKVIQTFHTLAKLKQIYGDILNKHRKEKEYQLVQKVDRIIVSTTLECEDLLTYYRADAEKISIIPPGVNTDIFRPRGKKKTREKLKLDLEKPVVLFVGRIDPIKGISTLIEAIYLLSKKHKKFKDDFLVLLVGGDIESDKFWQKKEVKEIKNLIGKRELDCCVDFVGSVSHHQLPFYYSAADVVVLPSLYESFGLVVLEAMACGAAVIASSVGGLRFMIKDGENGLLFPRRDAHFLAKRLLQLFTDEALCSRLGKNARGTATNFSWQKQAKEVSKVYKKTIRS